MGLLAFDTSMNSVSVAYSCGMANAERRLVKAAEARRGGQAERLMPLISDVLARAGASFTDVQRLAVTLGPGAFTGVRTGIAAARALRLAAGMEVVGVTSLAVIAHRAFAEAGDRLNGRPVVVACDARRERLYVQVFGRHAHDGRAGPVDVGVPEAIELIAGLGLGRHIVVAGSGAKMLAAFDTGAAEFTTEVLGHIGDPDAGDLAEMAFDLVAMREITPIYVRPPDAKPQSGKSLTRTR